MNISRSLWLYGSLLGVSLGASLVGDRWCLAGVGGPGAGGLGDFGVWQDGVVQVDGGQPEKDVIADSAEGAGSAHADAGTEAGHGDETLAGHSLHGEVFNEGPRQAAEVLPGTGEVDFPVSTTEPVAQQYFNQGVGQLHGFWYFEAERSFRQAAAIDSQCAMFYWGMAMANLKNPTRALKFVAEANERLEGATPREKKWIEAVERFCTTKDGDGKDISAEKRAQQYTRDLEEVIFLQPDDLEAKAFLVGHLWENQRRELATVSHVAINALLQQIFDVAPMHPAHHYRIHLWDQRDAKQALASAAMCGPSAPGVAHMWHMPGHIYSALNRHQDAVWQMEASARVDHLHMMRYGVLPDQIHNYAHNNEWLSRNLMKVGRVDAALELADNMLSLPRHPQYNTGDKGSGRYGRQRSLGALTSYRMWDELLQRADRMFWDAATVQERQWEKWQHVGMAAAYLQREGDVQAALTGLQVALDERVQRQAKEVQEAEQAAVQAKDAAKEASAEAVPVESETKDGKTKESESQESESKESESKESETKESESQESESQESESKESASKESASKESASKESETQESETTSPAADVNKAEIDPAKVEAQVQATIQAGDNKDVAGGDTAASSTGGARPRTGRRRGRSELGQEIESLRKAVASIHAVQAAVGGRWGEALELAEKASGLDDLVKAEWRMAAGREREAWEAVNREVDKRPNDVVPLAVKVFLAHEWLKRNQASSQTAADAEADAEADAGAEAGAESDAKAEAEAEVVAEAETAEAADAGAEGAAEDLPVTREGLRADFERLRQLACLGDLQAPLLARLSEVASGLGLPSDWRLPYVEAADVGERPVLDSLGPAHWTPVSAPPLVVWNAAGEESRPLESTGKAKLVMFYLGFGCLHCMEQLQKVSPQAEAFAAQGVELVAVSSESLELLQQGLQNFDQSLEFPLYADRDLESFRAFRCYDDFESQPLHGTFLLGPDGRVLWQDIGHEPFMDVDFLLGEVPRLLQVWAP